MGYYFISIGGSGAKVMESLTHLCVAGLLPNKIRQEKLYFLSIDPDVGNGNLARSSAALNNFSRFQQLKVGSNTPLFKTQVEIANPFPWSPTERNRKLDDVMSYQTYRGTPLGNLYEALYTEEERQTTLNEGFRGRPSIGAAVLAQKVAFGSQKKWSGSNTPPWKRFSELVKQDVKNGQIARIFLAGSVFGGTGAAGMPTIAKLIQRTFETYYNDGSLVIGGALVLPYFSFTPTEQEDGSIYASSENFLTNTKAALKYYASRNVAYDSMYFIGEDVLSPVKNFSVGASDQKNDAHIVDFYGALAAVDFFQSDISELKECAYISRAQEGVFGWTDLPGTLTTEGGTVRIKERLGQFTKFILAYAHLVKPVLTGLASGSISDYAYPWFVDYCSSVDVSDEAVKNFDEYVESYVRWLKQVEEGDGSRKIELIRQNAFDADPARLEPEQFVNLVYDENSPLTIHELWYRLSEHFGKEDESAEGFGRFLRALYDCCANEEA